MADFAAIAKLPRTKAGRRSSLRQVVDLQQAIYESAMVLKADLPVTQDREERARLASSLASLAKGWQGLQDAKRIIRGKPLPGSLRPEARKKAKPQAAPLPEEP